MGICVECNSYVRHRQWDTMYVVVTNRCAHPENMIVEFDYIEGKAKLGHCHKFNKNGDCKYFIKIEESV